METNKMHSEFKEAVEPVIEFIKKYGNLNCCVIIKQDNAEMVEGVISDIFEIKD